MAELHPDHSGQGSSHRLVPSIAPVFSVATPTRNALSKLKRCVGSVRGQDGVSVEHVVQDACSDDGTPQWLHQQPDLQTVSERDSGMYDAINKAWARSSGSILSWLNSDEQYLPGALAIVAAYFEKHPDVDVLFGDYIVCGADGAPIALRREIPFRRVYVANSFLYAYSCTMFYRRRLYESGLLQLDPSLRYAADKDMLLRLEANGAKIRRLPHYVALFGIDGTNLSTHSKMAEEAELVRRRHGAFGNALVRRTVLALRRAERLLTGGYARHSTDYRFALDEVPNYLDVKATRVGGRYALNDGVAR